MFGTVVVQNLWKEEKDEQVTELVYKLCYEVLDVDMARADIISAFRIGKKPHENSLAYPRPILVRFSAMDIKTSVMKARSKMKKKTSVKGVYINDDLTEKRRVLLKALRGYKKEKLIEDCWSFNGRICFKTPQGIIHDVTDKSVDTYGVEPGIIARFYFC